MMEHKTFAILSICILGLAIARVQATPVEPTFDRFGELARADFGGNGIPNDNVAVTEASEFTLGLTAHKRFSENPSINNDGAGTFTALRGSNTPGSDPDSNEGALWNFAFFAEAPGSTFGTDEDDVGLQLLYDFDPGLDTDESKLGILDLGKFADDLDSPIETIQGSQNLLFGFLANDGLDTVTSPTAGAFDPDSTGEYSFALRATDTVNNNEVLARSAINVNMVPTPGAFGLLGLGLTGLGVAARRRR